MQITIPDDAGMLAQTQARAAGYSNIGDYVANLFRNQIPRKVDVQRRMQAIEDLQ